MTIYRYRDGALANTTLIIFIVAGLITTIILSRWITHWLAEQNFWASYLMVLLPAGLLILFLAQVLVLAAYLAHECMHNTLFKMPKYNDHLGAVLTWLLGAAYQPYAVLKEKHLRHHTERRDVLAIDYRQRLSRSPALFACIKFLQWCHLPAAELYTHSLSFLSPFILPQKRHLRLRVLMVAISRLAFYVLLYQISWLLLTVYIIALVLCIAVLGFMDAYQHTYTLELSLEQPKTRSPFNRDYEEQHTFTNLISTRYPWLNLAVLNFCYHNAHHWKSGEPWYRLPNLHRQRYGDSSENYIPFGKQLTCYHRYRTQRIRANLNQADSAAIGAAGVSFLVGV